MACSYCQQTGHRRTNCKERKKDEIIWLYQQRLLESQKQQDKLVIEQLARETIRKVIQEALETHTPKPDRVCVLKPISSQ